MKKLKGNQINQNIINKLLVNSPSINQTDFKIYTIKNISPEFTIPSKANDNIKLKATNIELYDHLNNETIYKQIVTHVYRNAKNQWSPQTLELYLMDNQNATELLNKITKFITIYQLLKNI